MAEQNSRIIGDKTEESLEMIKCATERKMLKLYLAFNGEEKSNILPKITVLFQHGQEERRLPVPVLFSRKTGEKTAEWIAGYRYRLDCLFPSKRIPDSMEMTLECRYQNKILEIHERILINQEETADQEAGESKRNGGKTGRRKKLSQLSEHFQVKLRIGIVRIAYSVFRHFPIKENRIAFLSNRRNDLSGNFENVYQKLEEEKKWRFWFWLDTRELKRTRLLDAVRLSYYCACAKVILVDDYVGLLYQFPRRKGTKMIQLWHACGAFKIFGYSRLGKIGQMKQESMAHRIYDYAIVSSSEIRKFYAEGFGLAERQIIPTGIPRTDCFWNPEWKKEKRKEFFEQYPSWINKKIILFAPTFRGSGKNRGFYPENGLNPEMLLEALKESGKDEWRILVKYHPFIRDREHFEGLDEILDVSGEPEINDLLPAADLIITDYSSLIFEAAILEIPMVFYAFDLVEYEKERGFYYDFEDFVPGRVVRSFSEVLKVIEEENYETEKIALFKRRFFDHWDGKSTERVVELIHKVSEE